jgi:hypothetical protein
MFHMDCNMLLLDARQRATGWRVAALLRRRPVERIAGLGFARQSRNMGGASCLRAKDEVPSRIEIIEAEYEADALVEARSKMSSNCSRAEVTRFDPPRASVVSLLRFLKASLPLQF